MKRAALLIIMMSLVGCATVEDQDCRRVADILGDADYYSVCLIQKRGSK